MLKKTIAQLAFILYTVALSPLLVAGFLIGFLGMSFEAGYYWGNKWAGDLWTYATGKGETWIARIED